MNYRHEIITQSEKFPIKYVIHNNARGTIVRHWHSALEISFTILGSIDRYYISGKTYKTKEKDILIINSNEIHSISVVNGSPNLALTLIFPFNFMKKEFPQIDKVYFSLNEREKFTKNQKAAYETLQCAIGEFYDIARIEKNDVDFLKLKAIIYNIFYLLIKNFSVEKESININTDKYIDRLSAIAKYIDDNYAHELNISDFADEFHLSVGYLSRFFKKYMGLSIHDYITLVRLNYAHELLLNSSSSIEYVAQQTGFPNDKAFTTVFKRVYKDTPYRYRKSHKMTLF